MKYIHHFSNIYGLDYLKNTNNTVSKNNDFSVLIITNKPKSLDSIYIKRYNKYYLTHHFIDRPNNIYFVDLCKTYTIRGSLHKEYYNYISYAPFMLKLYTNKLLHISAFKKLISAEFSLILNKMFFTKLYAFSYIRRLSLCTMNWNDIKQHNKILIGNTLIENENFIIMQDHIKHNFQVSSKNLQVTSNVKNIANKHIFYNTLCLTRKFSFLNFIFL
uniref:Uncharacterized protein n=1 Tax=Amorphochlora amoebiformis TaxID=1561963 RepID=A0A0H5BLF3_9EUKA|nr:hypothetical protein [Amorphochlora amoebiformis]